jgi:pimeloyl-ACP methyl ester carboxylesterase
MTGLVGAGIDVALAHLAPLLGESTPRPEGEAVLAALNGVLGDYLSETGNALAIPMRFRKRGEPLALARSALGAAFPETGGKLLVMVHGSSMNDLQWQRSGHDHGAALERDLAVSAVYLHYNSGLHISTNGRALAELLEKLVAEWPVPVEELAIVCHSMGGLVARSACHHGEAVAHSWRSRLGKLVCLGSPHHGAPLERGGNWVDLLLGISRYSAPLARLARIRSAGVTDMRFGNVLDEHWQGRDRFAHGRDPRGKLELPHGVACYAVAATLSPSPANRLRSDGIVPVESALGAHEDPALDLAFPEAHRFIGYGMSHLDLLSRREVYETLRTWLAS